MSATVPMEYTFGQGGNPKAAKRLRNLDLKRNRPAVHPLFGNTGSVVGRAYAATGGAHAQGPKPSAARPSSPLSPVGRNIIPTGIASQQGDDRGGGQIIPSPQAQNPVVPSKAPAVVPAGQVQQPQQGGFFSKGSNVVLAGGGLIALVLIVYMMFGTKKARRRRRSNNNKKGRAGRGSRR